ncbi:hypothetical protein D1007_12119 [Hordeum vulgare]|nr:hypothetical protein D1007_12119 [Hordeum vulgare]
MIAADSSEWGLTNISPASAPLVELSATAVALHHPTLFSSLLPPFLEFFNAILAHYQIRALHLDLRYVLLLSSFAFLCEAILGFPTSVTLFSHFFSLELTAPDQRSGYATFLAMDATASEYIDMKINHLTEGFRWQ